MQKDSRIFVAGHRGLVGSAIKESLERRGYRDIVTAPREELDLERQLDVESFFSANKFDVVFMAAAKVGGIVANNELRADFILKNLNIQNNIFEAANRTDVKKIVYLGSSCIYPRDCPQPMKEEHLLTGPLEYTNRPYAIAKIAGLETINALNIQFDRRYISVMPTNLYGPGDNFHPEHSHVLPALIRRFHEAKERGDANVTIWGSGSPKREFMYAPDCADAVVHVAESLGEAFFDDVNRSAQKFFHINIGTGQEVSIKELAELIKSVVGFEGELVFDRSKPDGTPRKLLDCTRLYKTGWKPKTALKEGISETYRWYLSYR